MAFEHGLYDAALNAAAAPMNQSHFAQPCIRCRRNVLLHDRRDVARSERVKIDLRLDGNPNGLGHAF